MCDTPEEKYKHNSLIIVGLVGLGSLLLTMITASLHDDMGGFRIIIIIFFSFIVTMGGFGLIEFCEKQSSVRKVRLTALGFFVICSTFFLWGTNLNSETGLVVNRDGALVRIIPSNQTIYQAPNFFKKETLMWLDRNKLINITEESKGHKVIVGIAYQVKLLGETGLKPGIAVTPAITEAEKRIEKNLRQWFEERYRTVNRDPSDLLTMYPIPNSPLVVTTSDLPTVIPRS